MSLSGIIQFLIGFILGVTLLAGSGAAAGYYFLTKLSTPPARPTFAEEKPPEPVAKAQSSAAKSEATPKPQADPSPSPTEAELPPGSYAARVTWAEGLSLRDGPTADAARIGGVAYNQEIIVLKESDDKRWQQVRLGEEGQEGWVKGGNIERLD